VRLVSERLVLREFVPADLAALETHQRDPRYVAHYPASDWPEGRMAQLLDWFLAWQREEPRYRWQMAVTLAATGELIGSCGIRLQKPGSAHAELGYGFSAAHWGQGYATEAARRMPHYAFAELSVHRVSATCADSNVRSQAVLGRLGFTREGCVREDQFIADVWHDTLLFGLLASEWAAGPI